MAVVNVLVVPVFTLLGDARPDRPRPAVGRRRWPRPPASAVAAVGTFAVLGNVFGITTSFQLLELANPSQPLLRRLLMETPGTYHHSLMVGQPRRARGRGHRRRPARRRASRPTTTTSASWPTRSRSSRTRPAGRTSTTSSTPEQSAAARQGHVANGIDLAYQYKLPKPLISFIPQHHGTALMSYFLAKAREQAVEEAGAAAGHAGGAEAAAAVDERRSATPDPSRSRARPPS